MDEEVEREFTDTGMMFFLSPKKSLVYKTHRGHFDMLLLLLAGATADTGISFRGALRMHRSVCIKTLF